ncbi:MAG TPA: hypothetical protein VF950_27240 [Planctomycetota bacterium]
MKLFAIAALLLAAGTVQEPPPGRRVLSAGHSFHVFMPGILKELASGIPGHAQVDTQSIGGSRVIQHWDLADEKNKAKTALKTGKVDVFTLSPIFLPDEGIAQFTQLALEHNPGIRVTLQEFWLPWDTADKAQMKDNLVDRDAMTGEELRKRHAPYFQSVDDHVRELNKSYGKPVVYVVPVGQAVVALREKIIAGQAPGLKTQGELFTDGIGHVRAPVQALNAYCHFAVIYRKSPVGLPMPGVLKKAEAPDALNRLLQELAWEAVVAHPLSGVQRPK